MRESAPAGAQRIQEDARCSSSAEHRLTTNAEAFEKVVAERSRWKKRVEP